MQELLNQIISVDPSGLLGSATRLVQSQFGTPGLIAFAVLGFSVLALIVVKVLKIIFAVVKYVVVPSVVLTFIASLFLPFPFVQILPAAVALFSVVLIFKA
jgi:hypothetical protein